MNTESIGYWWLGEDIINPQKELKAKFWWGVCKKTRKVAVVGVIPIYPIMVQSTHISNNECFDGNHCLNIDCPYAKSDKLIDAINKSALAGVNEEEHLVNFVEMAFKDVDNWFKNINSDELDTHFEVNSSDITISEHAFERVMEGI